MLPLFLQPHSFGTFARADPDDAAAPLLPERMTYNSITSIQKFVCDGDDPSYAGVQCGGDGAGTCALSHSGFTDTMDWCWTDTNQNDWCWCIESGGEGVYTQAHLDAAKKEGYDEGYAAGVASVDITSDNQAAFDEGVASVDLSEYKTISEIGNYGITVADVIPSDPVIQSDDYLLKSEVCQQVFSLMNHLQSLLPSDQVRGPQETALQRFGCPEQELCESIGGTWELNFCHLENGW